MLNKLTVFLLLVSGVISASKNLTRIGGGIASERNSRPFQVGLLLRVGEDGELGFCGGSLVHLQWVLTAAHCCYHGPEEVTNVEVILGAHSLYDRYENGRRLMTVNQVVVHPEWNPDTFANDLALLKLTNTVQASDSIGIVRLPYLRTVSSNFAGQAATASGWGIAANGVTFVSPTLRMKTSTVTTNTYCRSLFRSDLPDNIICTFSTHASTCKGDNGGPLTVFTNDTEEIILIGVASFIEADGCNTNLPNVFTRVQHYLSWISEVTGITLD